MNTDAPAKTIPSLDLSDFVEGSPEKRQKLAMSLLRTFSELGFLKLINHGIEEPMINELFSWVRLSRTIVSSSEADHDEQNQKLFALPLEVKMKAAHPPRPNPHRGYSYVGQEKLSMVADYEKGVREGKVVHDVKVSVSMRSCVTCLVPTENARSPLTKAVRTTNSIPTSGRESLICQDFVR